jgi:NAD(P)H-dependent FMN reductase
MSSADNEQRPCQIVGISGSIRPGSYTTMAVALALTGAEELQCETKLINLRDYALVFCDGKEDESKFPRDVFRLREEVRRHRGSSWARPSITADTVEC